MKWYHNSYSEEALSEMQKEAEERVRQMQSRARLVGNPEPSFHKTQKNITQNFPKQGSSFFTNLDHDSMIILALLWVLWNEKADSKLLLALLYILIL